MKKRGRKKSIRSRCFNEPNTFITLFKHPTTKKGRILLYLQVRKYETVEADGKKKTVFTFIKNYKGFGAVTLKEADAMDKALDQALERGEIDVNTQEGIDKLIVILEGFVQERYIPLSEQVEKLNEEVKKLQLKIKVMGQKRARSAQRLEGKIGTGKAIDQDLAADLAYLIDDLKEKNEHLKKQLKRAKEKNDELNSELIGLRRTEEKVLEDINLMEKEFTGKDPQQVIKDLTDRYARTRSLARKYMKRVRQEGADA